MIPNHQQFMPPFIEIGHAAIGSRHEQVLHLKKIDEEFFEN